MTNKQLTDSDYTAASLDLKTLPELSGKTYQSRQVVCRITLSQCWEIVSHKPDQTGYVILCHNYKRNMAHRISYEVYNGEIPEGMIVCHKCDNKKCVNPKHLFVGTYQDNTQDMIAKKGRFNTKLTIKQVREARHLYKSTEVSMRALARKYEVSSTCMREALNHISWRDV